MDTLDELLAEEASTYTNNELIVNADDRTIYIPNTLAGVTSDEKSTRLKLRCSRYVGDNIDLSTMNVYINFKNANGEVYSYLTDDVAVDGTDITFSWLLSRDVTTYKGNVNFIVCAKKIQSDGKITIEWNTTLATLTVLEGLEPDNNYIPTEAVDVATELKNDITALTEELKNVKNSITTVPTKVSQLENDKNYLTAVPEEYVTEDELNAHTNNTNIHVTAVDKNNWNGKFDSNQGTSNAGKLLGTNSSGDVVAIQGYGFEYDETTKMLKYGTDPTTNLNQGIGLDNTLSKKGYAAEASAVGELKSDLDRYFTTGNQLFDKSRATVNGYYNVTTNAFTPHSALFGFFVPVNGVDKITLSGKGAFCAFTKTTDTSVNALASYNIQTVDIPYTFTVVSGANYLYVGATEANLDLIMVTKGETALAHESYIDYVTARNKTYDELNESYKSDVECKIVLTEGDEDGYYNNSGNIVLVSGFSAKHIDLTQYSHKIVSVSYTMLQVPNVHNLLYKKDGVLYGTKATGAQNIDLTDCTDVYLNFFGSAFNDSYTLNFSPIIYEQDFERLYYEVGNISCDFFNLVDKPFVFSGKRALFFGDSITQGYVDDGTTITQNGYPKLFSEKVGFATYYNMGIGGSTFSDIQSEVKTIPTLISETDLTTFDYVFIAGGVNDWQLGCTLAEFEDAVKSCFDSLASYNGEVVIIAPINTGYHNLEVATLREFRNILGKQAMLHGFNFVDGGKFNFATSGELASYLFGGNMIIHPNENGYKQYAKALAEALC